MAVIDSKVSYAIQSVTIAENHIDVIDAVQDISEEDLIHLIDDLP